MDMTDLRAAIDDYSSTAEQCILGVKDRLDALETKMARPGAAPAPLSGTDAEHKAAFLQGFIQKGDTDRLKALEAKALSVGSNGDGGYAVPQVIDTEIEKQLRVLSPMRKLVKVKTIETSDYKRLVNVGGTGAGWVGETDTRGDTLTPKLQEVAIIPGEIYANAAATQRALDDMQFDAEAWLNEEVAEEFAAQESAAIISGDASTIMKPQGILTYATSAEADGTRAFKTIQHVITGTDGGFDATAPSDVLIDLVHTGEGYADSRRIAFDGRSFRVEGSRSYGTGRCFIEFTASEILN